MPIIFSQQDSYPGNLDKGKCEKYNSPKSQLLTGIWSNRGKRYLGQEISFPLGEIGSCLGLRFLCQILRGFPFWEWRTSGQSPSEQAFTAACWVVYLINSYNTTGRKTHAVSVAQRRMCLRMLSTKIALGTSANKFQRHNWKSNLPTLPSQRYKTETLSWCDVLFPVSRMNCLCKVVSPPISSRPVMVSVGVVGYWSLRF